MASDDRPDDDRADRAGADPPTPVAPRQRPASDGWRPAASRSAGSLRRPGVADPYQVPRRATTAEYFERRFQQRREKIRKQVQDGKNAKIPTWVLAAGLVAFLAAWTLLIILS